LRFTRSVESRVAWNEDDAYSMFDARLAITTISAHIEGLAP
jgi:hypothetical protein